ncbi:MAG: hypothetical protein AAB921_02845, partial [Patescibacteria group bacterium]
HDRQEDPKSGSALGTLVLMSATALATYFATKHGKKIVAVANTGATAVAARMQKFADEGRQALSPDKQNGTNHTAAAPAN